MFGLMFGDPAPSGNAHYSRIATFLKILEIVLSPKLDPGHHVYVEQLIKQLFQNFNTLFPEVEPTNKFHHLVPYPPKN